MRITKPSVMDTELLLAFHKSVFGNSTMTNPDPAAAPPAPPVNDPPPAPPATGTLTQEEVNRIAAKEKAEGKASTLREVQEALGVDLDTAKSILAEHKKNSDAQKSEAQREADAAKASREAADAEKATAATEVQNARLTTAFVLAGITEPEKIARYSKMVDAPLGASLDDIKKAVEKLKTDEPALFGAAPPKTPPAPGGDPKGGPPASKLDKTAYERGMERAKSHRGAFTAVVNKP